MIVGLCLSLSYFLPQFTLIIALLVDSSLPFPPPAMVLQRRKTPTLTNFRLPFYRRPASVRDTLHILHDGPIPATDSNGLATAHADDHPGRPL